MVKISFVLEVFSFFVMNYVYVTSEPSLLESTDPMMIKHINLFNISSLLSFGLESFPLSARLVHVLAVAVLIGCGVARCSFTLTGEDWASSSYFYWQL